MKKRMLSLAVLAASLFCFSNGANAQKTEKLFNGKDLSNWNFVVDKNSVPADQVYSVRDGKIFITGQPFGYMYTTCLGGGSGELRRLRRRCLSRPLVLGPYLYAYPVVRG